jgi:alpha-galactosidase
MTLALLSHDDGRVCVTGLAREPVAFSVAVEARELGGRCRRWCPAEGDGSLAGELELTIAPRQDGEALVLDWRIRSRAPGILRLDRVSFASDGPGWPLLADPSRLTLLQHGYQSWTPTAPVRADARPRHPRVRSFALMNLDVDSPFFGRRDGLESSLFALLRADGEDEAALCGFCTQRIGLGAWFFRNRGQPGLRGSLDYGGRHLAPGAVLEGEPLWIGRGPAGALLARYAAALGAAMGARVAADSPVGWCSWYHLYTRVTARDVTENAAELARHPELGVRFVQLDDGYQAAVGDWLDVNDKFPGGLAPVAADLRARGFSPGLWTAPFFAAARSRLLRAHPDWRLRDERGHPVQCGFNPMWGARTHALDLTHPEVLAWLGETFAHLFGLGFEFFKVDFLYAGLRHGHRHDPACSPLEAYRAGLGSIRAAVGEEAFVLGCGAPLGPSVGLVDGMRISQDVKEQWDSGLAAFFGQGCGYPAARGALRNDLSRAFTHRRWWLNDPDCLLVRDVRTKLSEEEVRTLVAVLGATGGMLLLSDEVAQVSPARLELVRGVLPPTGLVPAPLDPLDPRDLVLEGQGGTRLVVLVNLEDTPEVRPLPGQPGTGTWIDVGARAQVAGAEVALPPHGARALRYCPAGDTPCLAADGLHLTAGLDGRLNARFDPEGGRLHLAARAIARAAGWLALYVPAPWALREEALPTGVRLLGREGDLVWIELCALPPWERALSLVKLAPPA